METTSCEISAIFLKIQVLRYKKRLTDEILEQEISKTENIIEFMAKTIDDFRNFFAKEIEKKRFSVNFYCKETLKLISDNGTVEGICRIREGIHPLSAGIEHGCGRDGEGGASVIINGELFTELASRKTGVLINRLGLKDSSKGDMEYFVTLL